LISAPRGIRRTLLLKGRRMSLSKKTKNAVDAAKGSAKDLAGRVKNDKDLEVEGKAERAVADLKQAGEKMKDAFKR
jgi:uncharacterized protein YjbJ (UPF0337 family)